MRLKVALGNVLVVVGVGLMVFVLPAILRYILQPSALEDIAAILAASLAGMMITAGVLLRRSKGLL